MSRRYGYGKHLDVSFDVALERTTQALQQQGFGVLSDIDVAATLKKTLDFDMPPYRILGACNPRFAQRALATDPQIGLLLPCNVVVRQDSQRKVSVEFMDPDALLELVNKPEMTQLAAEVRQRLISAMEAI